MITFRRLGRLGRLGNQLFQYAGTRLYAEANGYPYAFPRWSGCDIFADIPTYTPSERVRSWFLPTVQLDDISSYTGWDKLRYVLRLAEHLPETTSMEHLYAHPRDNMSVYGYLQDDFSMGKVTEAKPRVLSWFRFRPDLHEQLREATMKYRPWIAVHIRRGDLVRRNLTVPLAAYRELLERITRRRNIYIASDDPFMHEKFTGLCPALPEIPGGISPMIFDFWMLANAETVVGCGSTFSWWAAFLGNRNDYYGPLLTHLWPAGYIPTLDRRNL